MLRRPLASLPLGTALANDVETDRDYNVGLKDVRSQRKAHWVETHATVVVATSGAASSGLGGEVWDCAYMDGYMCECRNRTGRAPRRARRCHVSAACYE